MNDCTQSPRVSAYYDGELGAQDRQTFAAHLVTCPACQAELVGLGQLTAALRGVPRASLPAGALARMHRRLDWAAPPVALDRWARRLALAACVALMAAVGFYAVRAQSSAATPVATQMPTPAEWEMVAIGPAPSDRPSTAVAPETTQEAQLILAGLGVGSHD